MDPYSIRIAFLYDFLEFLRSNHLTNDSHVPALFPTLLAFIASISSLFVSSGIVAIVAIRVSYEPASLPQPAE